jgi:hypothetical protein
MHVETCQNRVTTDYNRLVAFAGDTRLIHKLPLILNYSRNCSLLREL